MWKNEIVMDEQNVKNISNLFDDVCMEISKCLFCKLFLEIEEFNRFQNLE